MGEVSLFPVAFWLLASITMVSAGGVAFSNNIVYSAFSLMGTLMGAAGLYVLLAADFVAVVQVLIYVGGVLVLTLFAVMLTHRVGDVQISNRSVGGVPALVMIGGVAAVMVRAIFWASWPMREPGDPQPTIKSIGNLFLTDYVLPFELASIVLLAVLIGAVVLSRKELGEGR